MKMPWSIQVYDLCKLRFCQRTLACQSLEQYVQKNVHSTLHPLCHDRWIGTSSEGNSNANGKSTRAGKAAFHWQIHFIYPGVPQKRFQIMPFISGIGSGCKVYETVWNKRRECNLFSFRVVKILLLFRFLVACCIVHVAEAYSALIRSASDTAWVRNLGTALPKFHIHMFTSYSLLPSPEPWFLSARPCLTLDDLAKCRGIVGWSLPSI